MLHTLLFVIAHFALCVLFFVVVQKPLFILYNRRTSKERIKGHDLKNIFVKGVKTDRIAAAYLTGLPVVALMLLSVVPYANAYVCLSVFEALLALCVSLAVVSDTVLYSFWQFKLEVSALSYLKHPKEAFASVSVLYVLGAVVAIAIVGAAYYAFMLPSLLLLRDVTLLGSHGFFWHVGYLLLCLVVAAACFAIIRGLNRRPNTPFLAYFSENQFLNHCSLNPLYSFIFSTSIKNGYGEGFRPFNSSECAKEFAAMCPNVGTPRVELLRTKRPNILIFLWESLAARYMSTLGGEADVLPNLERLAEEGVLFTRCDAGSFRTERGLLCVLGGLPGQPTENAINHARMLPKLPALPRVLKSEGYETLAVHGGNCRVLHMGEWFLASGHQTLVEQKDFPDVGPSNHWGYHDGGTMNWLYDEIQRKTQAGKPWFTTYLSLSSHQPFDVPYHRLPDLKQNSFAYVDECFGRFVDRLKSSPAWDDLLMIVVGDHGFIHQEPMVRETFPHIPMLWLGGAVKQPMKIDKIVAQTDIPATLLGQLGLPHDEFKFSRDVLADTYTYPFSLHTYNNGFLFRDDTGFTDFDNVADKAVKCADAQREHNGKVMLQTIYEYLASM